MSHVFQSEFPAHESLAIADAVRKGNFGPQLIRPAWVVAEYALNHVAPEDLVGEPTRVTSTTLMGESEHEDAFERLHAMAFEQLGGRSFVGGLAVPWTTIVAFLLRRIASMVEGDKPATE